MTARREVAAAAARGPGSGSARRAPGAPRLGAVLRLLLALTAHTARAEQEGERRPRAGSRAPPLPFGAWPQSGAPILAACAGPRLGRVPRGGCSGVCWDPERSSRGRQLSRGSGSRPP